MHICPDEIMMAVMCVPFISVGIIKFKAWIRNAKSKISSKSE